MFTLPLGHCNLGTQLGATTAGRTRLAISRRAAVIAAVIAGVVLAGFFKVSAVSAAELTPPIWQLKAEGSPVAGVPFTLRFQGNASGTESGNPDDDADPAAGYALLPKGVGCPASFAEVAGPLESNAWHWTRGDVASEPFNLTQVVTLDDPGTYPLCGYFGLEGELDIEADAAATKGTYSASSVTVARPTVTADLKLEGRLHPGAPAVLKGTATSNAPETFNVFLNKSADQCAATAAMGSELDQFNSAPDSFDVYGSKTVSQAVELPDIVGTYRLCAYSSRDGKEGDPDLVKDLGTVTVKRAQVALSASFDGLLRPGQLAGLNVTGSSDAPVAVDLFLNDASTPCQATPDSNSAFDQFANGPSTVDLSGGGSQTSRQEVRLPLRPGSFHLCGYAARYGAESDPDYVKDLGTVTVGRVIATVDPSLQGFLVPSGYVQVKGTASADAPFSLSFQFNHRDQACESTGPANLTRNRFRESPDDVDVTSAAGQGFSLTAQLPSTAGTYHLCVYGVRDGADGDPDLIFDSASRPGGSWLVQPQDQTIGEVIYADGSAGTRRVSCKVPKKRVKSGVRVRIRCANASGTVKVRYRRISPGQGKSFTKVYPLSSNGRVTLNTKKLRPGLYRVRVVWKGWEIKRVAVRISRKK